MNLDQNRTIREWVREIPAAAAVFEEMGIEYCCDGAQTFDKACASAHRTVVEVRERIANRMKSVSAASETKDWGTLPLGDLMGHIVETHHAFTRQELERLAPLARTVARVHGKFHPELLRIQSALEIMSADLNLHMNKEEEVVFPYIAELEDAALGNRPGLSPRMNGLQSPLEMMMSDHEATGQHLHSMRDASANYEVPSGGCLSYRSFYQGLQALEKDLHQHISLENNILFPRALQMEASTRKTGPLHTTI